MHAQTIAHRYIAILLSLSCQVVLGGPPAAGCLVCAELLVGKRKLLCPPESVGVLQSAVLECAPVLLVGDNCIAVTECCVACIQTVGRVSTYQ